MIWIIAAVLMILGLFLLRGRAKIQDDGMFGVCLFLVCYFAIMANIFGQKLTFTGRHTVNCSYMAVGDDNTIVYKTVDGHAGYIKAPGSVIIMNDPNQKTQYSYRFDSFENINKWTSVIPNREFTNYVFYVKSNNEIE